MLLKIVAKIVAELQLRTVAHDYPVFATTSEIQLANFSKTVQFIRACPGLSPQRACNRMLPEGFCDEWGCEANECS